MSPNRSSLVGPGETSSPACAGAFAGAAISQSTAPAPSHNKAFLPWDSGFIASLLNIRILFLAPGHPKWTCWLAKSLSVTGARFECHSILGDGSHPRIAVWVPAVSVGLPRSEERRVGKECRSGWWG